MIDCTNTYAAMHGYISITAVHTYMHMCIYVDYQNSLSCKVEKEEVDSSVSKPALIS